jgi:peptide deformylase
VKVLRVVKYPNRILSEKSSPVDVEAVDVEKLAFDLRFACLVLGGVAVAAPQVGMPIRAFYLHDSGESFLALNPEILYSANSTVRAGEGCLSVPGKEFSVERSTEIAWTYTDVEGVRHQEGATGWKARIIQHEMDHLRGICLPDLVLDSKNGVQEL